MPIQRHFQRYSDSAELFKDYSFQEGDRFNWFMGDGKIGIVPNNIIGAMFLKGIMTTDDPLLLKKNPEGYCISRNFGPFAFVKQGDSRQIEELSHLIEGNDVTHLYLSATRYGPVFTFSSAPPSADLYVPGDLMTVRIDYSPLEKAVDQAIRAHQQ